MSNARKTLESGMLCALAANADKTGLTIDKSHWIVNELFNELFSTSTVWAVREYLKEIGQYETQPNDEYCATMK